MRHVVSITGDVTGESYRSFIAEARQRYVSFSLVWRDQLSFDASARAVQQEIQRFEVRRSHCDRWPGTRLLGTKALVVHYSMDAAETGILGRSGSLFGWRSPRLPEDLCFYDATGSCVVVTVAHEQTAWFYELDWFSLLPREASAEMGAISKHAADLLQPDS